MSQRRLMAIMFTDLVGYSALMQADEALALDLLEVHFDLLRPIITHHDGREIKTIGDAFMLEFSNALDSVKAAIAMQAALEEYNQTADEKHQLRMRIGIHLGDVEHRGSDIFGDGVNIAARIEPLATPGSICISAPVYASVRNQIALPFFPMGEQVLKNMEQPVLLFSSDRNQEQRDTLDGNGRLTNFKRMPSYKFGAILLVALAVLTGLLVTLNPPLEAVPRIVVMPPVMSSPDVSNDIALWASDDLRDLLTEMDELEIIGRASTMMSVMESPTTGMGFDTLGVTHTIRSELIQRPGLIQYDVVVSKTDGESIWSDSFKGAPLELFGFQKAVVEGLAKSLGIPSDATGLRIIRLRSDPTEDLEAFVALVKGEAKIVSDPMCTEAMEYLERARELDPTMGRVYWGIGMCQGLQAWIPELPRDMPLWEAAILNLNKAAALDPSLAVRAWEMAANFEAARNQWEPAQEFLKRAREIDPTAFSFVLANSIGACREVVDWAQRQTELDPLMPMFAETLSNAYATCPGIIDFDKAVYWMEFSEGIAGASASADRMIPIYLARGDRDKAMRIWQNNTKLFYPQLSAADVDLMAMGNLRLDATLDPRARPAYLDLTDDLVNSGVMDKHSFVFDYVAIGAVDEAYESIFHLIKQNRFNIHAFMAYGAGPDAITRDSRFADVMAQIGMLAFWQQHGFPPHCATQGEDSFTCLPTEQPMQ